MDAASALDLARIGGTKPAVPYAPKGDMRAIDKAARDFEAVFIGQMLEQMWTESSQASTFGGGTGERIFRSMMIQDVGRQIANDGGIGLAANIKREMLAMQERRQ